MALGLRVIVATTFGGRAVFGSQATRRRVNHDPWPLHSASGLNFDWGMAASGTYFGWMEGMLLDGNQYYWICAIFPDATTALLWLSAYQNFTTFDGLSGFIGEWWNYAQRAQTFDKVLYGNLAAWLAAH